MSDLLPCPFCGSEKLEVVRPLGRYQVKCRSCRAMGPLGHTEFLSDEWNRRPNIHKAVTLRHDGFIDYNDLKLGLPWTVYVNREKLAMFATLAEANYYLYERYQMPILSNRASYNAERLKPQHPDWQRAGVPQ